MRSPRRPLAALSAAAAAAVLLLAPHAGAQTRPVGLEGVPHFDHVVVLTEENEAAATTFAANSPARYLKSLRSKG
ncbi:MAG: hypothetical protein ACXVFU_15375, partial [Nocardioidaceae bacterium]